MEIFNNTTNIVRDDLEKRICAGSRISVAAACFSMYAYQELKDQLEKIDDHIRSLAEKLNVPPEKLLSHVLEYEIQVI